MRKIKHLSGGNLPEKYQTIERPMNLKQTKLNGGSKLSDRVSIKEREAIKYGFVSKADPINAGNVQGIITRARREPSRDVTHYRKYNNVNDVQYIYGANKNAKSEEVKLKTNLNALNKFVCIYVFIHCDTCTRCLMGMMLHSR